MAGRIALSLMIALSLSNKVWAMPTFVTVMKIIYGLGANNRTIASTLSNSRCERLLRNANELAKKLAHDLESRDQIVQRLWLAPATLEEVTKLISAEGQTAFAVYRVKAISQRELVLKIRTGELSSGVKNGIVIQNNLADLGLAPRVVGVIMNCEQVRRCFPEKAALPSHFYGILMEEIAGGWNTKSFNIPEHADNWSRSEMLEQLGNVRKIHQALNFSNEDPQFLIDPTGNFYFVDLDDTRSGYSEEGLCQKKLDVQRGRLLLYVK